MPPRINSFADFDRPYRKGVVLGLSLAEIFIILTFLLLLALIGFGAFFKEAEQKHLKTNNLLKVATTNLSIIEEENFKLEQKIEVLKAENKDLVTQNETYKNLIKDAPPDKLTSLIKKITRNEKKIKTLQKDLEKSNTVLDKLKKIGVKPEEIAKKLEKTKNLEKTNNVLTAKISKATQQNKQLKLQIANLNEKLKGTLPPDGIGQDSPCWFKLIPDRNIPGKFEEKGTYIFNIRIYDQSVFVKDIAAPNEQNKKQKANLKFDREKLNKNITFDEFLQAFRPLHKAGLSRKVRLDRRCRFYVRLWNETTDLKSYQHAKEDIVESIFITYRYKEDPWPH